MNIIAVFFLLSFPCSFQVSAQSLNIDQIMEGKDYIGHWPENTFWSEDSKTIYFYWNPEKNKADSLYKVSALGGEIQKVSLAERKKLPSAEGTYSQDFKEKIFVKDQDIFWMDIGKNRVVRVTHTEDREYNVHWAKDEQWVVYQRGQNLFAWDKRDGSTRQITHFESGRDPEESKSKSKQRTWLESQQEELIDYIKDQKEEKELSKQQNKVEKGSPKKQYLGKDRIAAMQLHPKGNFLYYSLQRDPSDAKSTEIPFFVTEDGYTEGKKYRTKVGDELASFSYHVLNLGTGERKEISYDHLPGLKSARDFWSDYPEKKAFFESLPREVLMRNPVNNPDGTRSVMEVRSRDNKDRWIVALNWEDASIKSINHQHDPAWVAGPGIGSYYGGGFLEWMPDGLHVYVQSEESGYSHLYQLNTENSSIKALTEGDFELISVQLSRDKKHLYLLSTEGDFGQRHWYKMPAQGGKRECITEGEGSHQVKLSPDEKKLAVLYSKANQPWELYLQDNKAGSKPKKITESRTEEFKKYSWRSPAYVQFEAEDGTLVPARLYRPEASNKNDAAVIFVHGAGYLQNAHKWWSSYFREYMFHNFLVDQGYTVLDIDYRGSAGYGRDWRTAIYRHMGGKDLSDQVDGVKYLIEKEGIDPKRFGIYGGSYGGFITLMAMFNHPESFQAGAALRSVTDWAHYNHGYTSNILNEPYTDSLAYARSSPIYFAEGLEGALLIAHGMVDVNVHFQDVVRLSQRLIELRKENWEMAVYPVEDHAFTEASSWADEYRRIFKLFEENIGK